MTSDEIRAAIHRVGNALGRTIDEVVEALCDRPVNGCVLRGKLIDLLRQADPETHMELPRDRDGVPIHIGDEMDCGEHFGVQEVEGFIHGAVAFTACDPFTVCDPQPARICTCPAHMTHHYHKLTVEDVLREYGDEVRRCCDTEDTITEYAAKLREVIAYE